MGKCGEFKGQLIGGGGIKKTSRMNIVGNLNLGVNQKLPPRCFPQSHHPVNLFPNVFCSRPSSTNNILIQILHNYRTIDFWETNQVKIETNLSKGAFDPEHFVSTKRFPPPRFKFGERIVPERTDNKRPLHILLRP